MQTSACQHEDQGSAQTPRMQRQPSLVSNNSSALLTRQRSAHSVHSSAAEICSPGGRAPQQRLDVAGLPREHRAAVRLRVRPARQAQPRQRAVVVRRRQARVQAQRGAVVLLRLRATQQGSSKQLSSRSGHMHRQMLWKGVLSGFPVIHQLVRQVDS